MKVIRLAEANFDKVMDELNLSDLDRMDLEDALKLAKLYDEVAFICPDYIYTDGTFLASNSWCIVIQPYLEAMFKFDYPQDQSEWFEITRKSRQQSTRLAS